MTDGRVWGSFRDPSGFVFIRDCVVFRQVNRCYREHYEWLMDSGLYDLLVSQRLLIPHSKSEVRAEEPGIAFKVLKPERVPFISYPYEWSFSQLKDAALVTLRIQKMALAHGMSLKDASSFNIQFHQGKPMLIDTLSFEKQGEVKPWVAYQQFCRHFLAPLALMAYKDVRLGKLLSTHIDGIPLDLASSLLPARTRLKINLASHIHLHAKFQTHFEDKQPSRRNRKISEKGLLGIIESLLAAVNQLQWNAKESEWTDYYDVHRYSKPAFEHKKEIVADFLDQIRPSQVWDLGANLGIFSQISARRGISTIAFDADPAAVERNYLLCRDSKEQRILPLLIDFTNPSPPLGWWNKERLSWMERGPTEMALALALVHHLAISNNIPLESIAQFFGSLCKTLIIEFVPKSDLQVRRLLATREDIFENYNQRTFEEEFERQFFILDSMTVRDSERIIYSMEKRA